MKKSSTFSVTWIFFLFILIYMIVPVQALAQVQEIPLHREKYELNSGYYIGDQTGDKLVYTAVVNSPGAPWLEIHFGSYNLGKNSYLVMTSLYDNKWQRQDNEALEQWYNYSAFFNGDAVKIELYAAYGDQNIFFNVDELVIGDWFSETESICGPTDDRVASSDPAAGRIVDIGCTGWIIPDGDIVTAGHCLDASSANILEFNVPLSTPGGTIQHPGPEDQYSIDQSSRIFINGGVGNDFGVCKVFPNSVTGLMPKEAQQSYFTLVQDLSSDPIRITGYGVDDGTANQTQQTHSGPNAGSSGTTMRYVVDTEGGNSGSPVIDDNTHFAVGVHTHGGCSSSGGNNNGTSLFHAAFWEAVEHGSGGCGVELASDPVPANSSTNVSINLSEISWANGAGAVSNELYFGTDPGALTLVQSGSLSTNWTITSGPLSYMTAYFWQVVEIGDTCSSTGPVWSFTTEQDPSIVTLFFDDFESGLGAYTINTTGGCPWALIPISSRPYTLPPAAQGNALAADADLCGSSGGGSSGSITLNAPIDASMYMSVAVEWDNDWQAINAADFAYLDVSTDGGSTWMNVVTFDVNDVRNTHEYFDISSMVGLNSFMLRLVSVQPGWDWWWACDNLQVTGWDFVPVELSSFTANTSNGNVVLNWTTASETNNKGFEVQRSSGGEYQTIAFVQGNGTSTQQHSYTYSDQKVENGNYSYRLRQVDFDRTSEYSQVVEVSVNSPVEFNLAQNYPNPFNPSTKINYSLKVDSKVTLKVFDILGQEVVTLLNENIAAGAHNVTFDASKLNSGVYLYKIEANGVDGSSFTSVKKMILTK